MAEQISTNTSKLTCLCGAVNEPGSSLVAEHFPISAGFCSCGICRQSTGALGNIPIRLKTQPSAVAQAACRVYAATDRAKRYFCSTCGSHVFIYDCQTDKWFAFSGIIDRTDKNDKIDTLRITKVGFLSDTHDGGMAGRLRTVALQSDTAAQLACYPGMPSANTEVPLLEADKLWHTHPSAAKHNQHSDKVPCSCHCGSVQFDIVWPDAGRNDLSKVSRWLRSNGTRYKASICVCRSCRLATSIPFVPWSYVTPENILTTTGEPIDFGFHTKLEKLEGSQIYYSSADSKRSFCGTCGASLFYECEDRPQVVDISVGIIHSTSGVMAEDILGWDWSTASWIEDGQNPSFLKQLLG